MAAARPPWTPPRVLLPPPPPRKLSNRWIRPRVIDCRQHRLRSVRSTGK